MKFFTYSRVSSVDQDLAVQRELLKERFPTAAHYEEKKSATSMNSRVELHSILKAIGKGDKLVVWRLDRLARNMSDLVYIVDELEKVGAALVVCDQNIDTSNVAQRVFVQMLGIFAEFETNLRKERQKEGLARARREDERNGVNRFKGKQPNRKKHDLIKKYLIEGFSPSHVAKLSDSSESTVFRVKRKMLAEDPKALDADV